MFEILKKRISESVSTTTDSIKLIEEDRNKRLEICKSCENLGKLDFCKICACHMPTKTYLPMASCPIKKWDKIHFKK